MNFTHSTSNKASPTQRHRTPTTISFFFYPSHVFFLPVLWKLVCPYASSCSLSLLQCAQCTRSYRTHGLNWHLALSVMGTYTWLPHETACCWESEDSPVNSSVFDRFKQSLAPVYTHLNYSPTSNRGYQLWVSVENDVTGWLISSGSGASALCTQKLCEHSLVGTQRTS